TGRVVLPHIDGMFGLVGVDPPDIQDADFPGQDIPSGIVGAFDDAPQAIFLARVLLEGVVGLFLFRTVGIGRLQRRAIAVVLIVFRAPAGVLDRQRSHSHVGLEAGGVLLLVGLLERPQERGVPGLGLVEGPAALVVLRISSFDDLPGLAFAFVDDRSVEDV